MAMEIAGKVIEREISEEDHAKLIDEFITNVGGPGLPDYTAAVCDLAAEEKLTGVILEEMQESRDGISSSSR